MIKWIERIIHPPGIQKKNRFSIFALIGAVADIMRADALKAFNAHFPYTADSAKLEEHGRALLVPRLLEDTEKEYRDRVATASFFLMRSGERGYVIEQLQAHFGERYVVDEKFLELYVKILEINDSDRTWVFSFLDELLDPNISLTVADWFRFVEYISIKERHSAAVKKRLEDFFPYPGMLRYDGRFLCDQGEEVLCAGGWLCGGEVKCERIRNRAGTVTGIIYKSVFCDGSFICDAKTYCSGYQTIEADGTLPLPIVPSASSSDICESSLTLESAAECAIIAESFVLSIRKLLRCNGSSSPSCALCGGEIICDGSYAGFNGRYYNEDILQEAL